MRAHARRHTGTRNFRIQAPARRIRARDDKQGRREHPDGRRGGALSPPLRDHVPVVVPCLETRVPATWRVGAVNKTETVSVESHSDTHPTDKSRVARRDARGTRAHYHLYDTLCKRRGAPLAGVVAL